ncbi:MAG TPA: DNA polymerase III subunit delta [Anaerolineaceae bacterium]
MADSKPVVYILHGDDEYAISQYIASMVARLGDPSTAELNYTRLDGRTASDNDLRSAAGSIPFLSDRRIVVLSNPFARQPEGSRSPERAAWQQRFLALLDSLPPTTALVICVEDHVRRGDWEILGAGHWLNQWAEKAESRALVKVFALPAGAEMQRWVRKTAEKQGGEFSPAAAAGLVELIGSDTRVAALEIDKALTYVDRLRPVERADVEAVTARADQPDVFAMVDALGARDGQEASYRLHVLLEEQDVRSIFSMIVRQFRYLLLAREILDRGGGIAQVKAELGREPFRMPGFLAEKVVSQAGRFTLAGLEDIYRRLLALDEASKTSQGDPSVALDVLIAELASGR